MVEMTEIRKGASVTRSFALARESTGALLPQSLSLKNVQVKRRRPSSAEEAARDVPRRGFGARRARPVKPFGTHTPCLTGDVRGYYHLGRRKYAGPFCGSGVWVSGESRLTREPGLRCSFAQESAGLELRQGAGTAVSCRYMLALAFAAVARNRATITS